jgi:hypothetical protein
MSWDHHYYRSKTSTDHQNLIFMLKMTGIRSIALLMLLFPALIVIQSCKKSSGGGDTNTSGYYLTASLGGQAWSANVKSPTLDNSPAIAGITTANGVNFVVLVGLTAANKDTTAIALVFPQNIQLNKPFAFDATKYLEGAYISETAPGASTYYGYNTTPATGGSGTITVTTFDQTGKVIEGSFSGVFGSQTGRAAIPVTNGKFRCVYTTGTSSLPLSGLKF